MKDSECACSACVSMCKYRPCWGTPEEAEKIIQAGFSDKLMLDWWVGAADCENTLIISPACKGYGGKRAPEGSFFEITFGRCLFLKNDLCILHDPGLKPFEGRKSSHDLAFPDMHEQVAKTWDTEKGRQVVQLWKDAVNYE